MSNIYEKLMHMQQELKSPKNQYNKFGGYSYRNTEDVLEGLKPLLSKYKAIINISDEVVMVGDRYYVKSIAKIVDIESDELAEVSSIGYAREDEKRTSFDLPQITGSSSSYARKYALNGLFAIDDTKDSDYTNKGNKQPSTTNSKKKSSTKQSSKGSNKASEKQINLITNLAKRKNYELAKITEYIKKEFKKKNSKELTKQEASKLIEMLKNLGGK